MKPILRVALYARVSTSDQNCEMQLTDLRAEVARRGWTLYQEYIDTASGAKARRPALDVMMADAALGKFDVLMVWKLDRFGRSVMHLCEAIDKLRAAKVRFISATQGLDTEGDNAVSRMLFQMLGVIAEFERALILERSKAGRERIMAEDRPDSWSLPIGFAVVDGFPAYDPDRLPVAQRIYELRERGKSVYQIEDLLAEAGMLAKRGGRMGHSAIVKVLRSRCYGGEYFRSGRVWPILDRAGNLLAPIPRERFERVHRAMNEVREATVGRPPAIPEKLILHGKVRCWRCGSRCVAVNGRSGGKRVLYYRCTRNANRKRTTYCAGCNVNALKVEAAFWEEFWARVNQPAQFHASAVALAKEAAKTPKDDPRAQLKKARAELEKVVRMTREGFYTMDRGKAELDEVKGRIATLEIEARALGNVVEIAPLDVVKQACAAFASGPEPEREDQREVIERVLDLRVEVKDGVMIATGNIPVAASAQNGGNTKGSRGKNCTHDLTGVDNSFAPIPFRIKRRVA